MITTINEWKVINENQLPEIIQSFLNNFPNDAVNWSQATDEIRDLSRLAKEFYNELDLDLTSTEVQNGKGLQPLNFNTISTPAEWNTLGKEYITKAYQLMSPTTKDLFLKEFLILTEQE